MENIWALIPWNHLIFAVFAIFNVMHGVDIVRSRRYTYSVHKMLRPYNREVHGRPTLYIGYSHILAAVFIGALWLWYVRSSAMWDPVGIISVLMAISCAFGVPGYHLTMHHAEDHHIRHIE